MKTASKVLIIISIIVGFFLCIVASIVLIATISADEAAVGIVLFLLYGALGGVSIGLGFKSINLINNAHKANDISTAWKVVILLLVNQIAGIILLCMKDEDFDPVLARLERDKLQRQQEQTQQVPNSDLDRLASLKNLYDMGALTEDEYAEQKRKILGL